MMRDKKEKVSQQGLFHWVNSQYEDRTLEAFRTSVQGEAQELFAHALRGGILGFYYRDDLPLYFVSDELLRELQITYAQFSEQFNGKFIEMIHPEDRNRYTETMIKSLEKEQIYEIVCRIKTGEQVCYMRDIGKKVRLENGTEIVLISRSNVTDILEYQQELQLKAISYMEINQVLKRVTDNIPGGVCTVALDSHYTLIYGNKEFYKLLGYSREQFEKEKNNYLSDIIYHRDLEFVKNTLRSAAQKKEKETEFEHRMVQRDGTILWFFVKGNLSYRKNIPELSCFVMEITVRKKIEEEAKINEERFRIALAQTDNTIFDYDIKSRVMIHGDRSAESYGLKQRTENVPESLLEMGVVHPDSSEAFLEMYQQICSGEKSASCLVKTRLKDGMFVWRKIIMTTIFDENQNPVNAVGILEDVDEQVRREEDLRHQMQRDTLTGLYNRGYMVSRIREGLENRKDGIVQAMIIIDIDDFKRVNDQYGHVFGDYVLSESGKRISSCFRKDEIIGRIGGDEFITFIDNLQSESAAVVCAQRIVKEFDDDFTDRGMALKVSCSVGLATCPKDGETFEVLYQNADIALYQAKKTGKNKASRYESSMEMILVDI